MKTPNQIHEKTEEEPLPRQFYYLKPVNLF